MTSSSKKSFEIETSVNECNPYRHALSVDAAVSFEQNENDARIILGFDSIKEEFDRKEVYGLFFQKLYSKRLTKSPEVAEWYEKITTWIPQDAEDWLYEQLENKEYDSLEYIEKENLRFEAESFFTARDSESRRPIGTAALIGIDFHDRHDLTSGRRYDNLMFNEIRLVVVEGSRQNEGVGQALIRAAVGRAAVVSASALATVAVSTNEAMIHALEKAGGRKRDNYFDRMLCWQNYGCGIACESCPYYTLYSSRYFPTHWTQDERRALRAIGLYEDPDTQP